MISSILLCVLACSTLNALPSPEVPFAKYGPPLESQPEVFVETPTFPQVAPQPVVIVEEKPTTVPLIQIPAPAQEYGPPIAVSQQPAPAPIIQTSYEYNLPEAATFVSKQPETIPVVPVAPAIPAENYGPPAEVLIAEQPAVAPVIQTSYEYNLPERVLVNKQPESITVVSTAPIAPTIPAEVYGPPLVQVQNEQPAVAPIIQTSYEYNLPDSVLINKQPQSISIVSAAPAAPAEAYGPPLVPVQNEQPAISPVIQTSYEYNLPEGVLINKQPESISVVSVAPAPPAVPVETYGPPAIPVQAQPDIAPVIQTSYEYSLPEAISVKQQPGSILISSAAPAAPAIPTEIYGPPQVAAVPEQPSITPVIHTTYEYSLPEAAVSPAIPVVPSQAYGPPAIAPISVPQQPAAVPVIQTAYEYNLPEGVLFDKRQESVSGIPIAPAAPVQAYGPPALIPQQPALAPVIQTSYEYELPNSVLLNKQPETASVISVTPTAPAALTQLYGPPAELAVPQYPSGPSVIQVQSPGGTLAPQRDFDFVGGTFSLVSGNQPLAPPAPFYFPPTYSVPPYAYAAPIASQYQTAPYYPGSTVITHPAPSVISSGPVPPTVTLVQNGQPLPENNLPFSPPGSVVEQIVPGHIPAQQADIVPFVQTIIGTSSGNLNQGSGAPYPPAPAIVIETKKDFPYPPAVTDFPYPPAVPVAQDYPQIVEEATYPYPPSGVPVLSGPYPYPPAGVPAPN